MSNLVEYARKELELIGAFSEKDDFYGGMTGDAVMELVEVFAKQGHSGTSANLVRNLFNKVADYKPLCALTLNDDEWLEVGEGTYQNKRNSAVFKEGKDGRAYYLNAYVKIKSDTNTGWGGSLELDGNKRLVRCYIKDVAKIPTINITPEFVQHSEEASDWDFLPASEEILNELKKYYDLEIIKL